MFACASTLVLAILGGVIATSGQCSTGTMQCCDELMTRSDAQSTLGLGSILDDVQGMVGVNCDSIATIAGGDSSCSAQSVCCTNTGTNGVTVIGFNCSPISA